MGRVPVSREVQRRYWQLVGEGVVPGDAGRAVGAGEGTARRWFRQAGGVMPSFVVEPSGYRLSLAEREEIAHLRSARHGVREIARRLGRSASTISREVRRGCVSRRGYRASVAQAEAEALARRPKQAKLVGNPGLQQEVQRRLELHHSPEQIAGRLPVDFPDDASMRVSHETIYQALYVQSRGALRRELCVHLRTGRSLRKPRRKQGERRGRIPNMVPISDRPAEVDERTVPGHWEGDLILGGSARSAIGTLVERVSGFTMLLHLPADHGALSVHQAMVTTMGQLPQVLRRTLTWDQGSEMASHIQIAQDTGLSIYVADPHSPWQRPTNENTNGLLRQYFPKGSDLWVHGPGDLDFVARELNNRPRQRLGWATPAEALDRLLGQPHPHPGPSGQVLPGLG